MTSKSQVPSREKLPVNRTWNDESVFPSEEAWQQAAAALEDRMETIEEHKTTLTEGPAELSAALKARDELMQAMDRVRLYASMSHFCDTGDPEAAAMHNRAQGLSARARSAVSFYEPKILDLGREKLEDWIETDGELADYRHYLLDLLRRAAHVRSEEVEQLLGMVQAPFQGVEGTATVLTNADFEFEPVQDASGQEHELTQSTRREYLASADRELRASVWRSYNAEYAAHKNSLSTSLLTSVQQSVFRMRARHFDSTLEAALFEHDVPTEVFHNLLAVCQRHTDTWQRYFELRRQFLGVDTLEPYDIWAPLNEERPQLSYEQAVDWICAGLEPMGEEYVDVVRRGCLEDRWVDVYPNQGKGAGAFSSGAKGTHPFIMMSYTGTIFDLSTLAHELGHSMHSYYAWRNQPWVLSKYSLFAAEVASNFHQAMVRAHLLETLDDPTLKLALLEEAFSNFHRYLLVMPTLARFELEVHESLERGEGLNANHLVDTCVDLFDTVYGDPLHVDMENMGMHWSQYPHLYRDYYVFQYATGISAAHALAGRILDGEQGAVQDYLNFLRTGGSKYPIDALRDAGVDMTQPGPIETAFETLSTMVDRLEELARS